MLRLRLPQAAFPSPLLGALGPVTVRDGVILDWVLCILSHAVSTLSIINCYNQLGIRGQAAPRSLACDAPRSVRGSTVRHCLVPSASCPYD